MARVSHYSEIATPAKVTQKKEKKPASSSSSSSSSSASGGKKVLDVGEYGEMLATNIRDLRQLLKWSRQQFVDAVHEFSPETAINADSVSAIEACRRRVSTDELVMFAGVFGVPVSYMLFHDPSSV